MNTACSGTRRGGRGRRRGAAMPPSTPPGFPPRLAGGLPAEQALERRDRVRALNREGKGIAVLLGTECDILDSGAMDYTDEVLKEFDYVIAAVHSKFTLPGKG